VKKQITLIAGLTLLVLLPCDRAAAATTSTAVSAAAAATEEIGHSAENLYDWGRQGDWTKADSDLAALKSAVARLEATGLTANLQGARRRLAAIEDAVRKREPRALMHAANEMTSVASELSRPFNPQIPVEVTLLDYDAREAELWAEEGKLLQLHEARMRLREDWSAARPAVVSKGGSTEAKQFDALVNQLTLAKSPKDFAAAATPILNSIDSLETVFTRASLPPGAQVRAPAFY
jgi:hypothetical protein